MRQHSFADLECNETRKPSRISLKLEKIDQIVDWSRILEIVSEVDKTGKQGGRPHKELLCKTKMLFLQSLYSLSDPELEDQVNDRLSFQKFCGIGFDASVPDFTTIWRFKESLIEEKLLDRLFELVLEMLKEQGVKLKNGTIVDATIIESSTRPLSEKRREEKAESPQVDTDARSTKKRGKWYFGYKGHTGVDVNSKLIKGRKFTSAQVHDSAEFADLVKDEKQAVFGDSAYVNKEDKRKFRQKGIYYGVLDRAYRNHPLSKSQKKRNKKKSRQRGLVEHPYAYIKSKLGYVKANAKNRDRNSLRFDFCCMIYNIIRGDYLLFGMCDDGIGMPVRSQNRSKSGKSGPIIAGIGPI